MLWQIVLLTYSWLRGCALIKFNSSSSNTFLVFLSFTIVLLYLVFVPFCCFSLLFVQHPIVASGNLPSPKLRHISGLSQTGSSPIVSHRKQVSYCEVIISARETYRWDHRWLLFLPSSLRFLTSFSFHFFSVAFLPADGFISVRTRRQLLERSEQDREG